MIEFVSIGSAMIDDIVLPDGATRMGVLGGGGPHAAAGMRVALSALGHPLTSRTVGLVSLMGNGFPEDAMALLQARFDTAGCIRKPFDHPRAWQLFEHDGRRTEVFRAGDPAHLINIPEPEEMPAAFVSAKGFHILREGAPARKWIAHLRKIAPHATILWEPAQRYMQPAHRDEFRLLLTQPDIVSPNLIEAASVYDAPPDGPALVEQMLADGANMVALRMGEAGSLIGQAGKPLLHEPALPVSRIVDQTGAGNMYCGAFLAGHVLLRNIESAGKLGAFAGNQALHQWGICLDQRLST
jgi:sugar/nucleoside kinase (ribokinase family)